MIPIILVDIEQVDIIRLLKQIHTERGIHIADLNPGAIVTVYTENSRYVFSITDPECGDAIMASSNDLFDGRQHVRIIGSTLGSSAIVVGWISSDMCLEFSVIDGSPDVTTTSLITRITVLQIHHPNPEPPEHQAKPECQFSRMVRRWLSPAIARCNLFPRSRR